MSGLNFYLGGWIEGILVIDFIGSSAGYRRFGYVVLVEFGIGFIKNSFFVFVSVLIVVYCNCI